MRLSKRILSAIMALTFVLSVCTMPVMAEEADKVINYPEYGTKAYGKMAFLEELGFFEGVDKMDLGRTVTRAEFAKWLCLIANKTNAPITTTVKFSDVNEDVAYNKEIINVVALGYMSGTGEGTFEPKKPITKQEAVAALVRLTGRNAFAIAKGGYPTGYFSVANSLHMLDSVAGEANAYNLLIMCYNTLRANMLVFSGANGFVETHSTNQTVMSYFHNIYEVEGVVTANSHTRLYTEQEIASFDSLEINEIVYATKSGADYNDLLGMTVRGFYCYDEINDTKQIVSVYANNDDNKVVEFEKDDLIPGNLAADHILRYVDENSRTKNVKLIRGFEYIFNGRVDVDREVDDLYDADRIKLIDRDTDGYYDTVIARRCETMQVESVDLYKNEVYTNNDVLKKGDGHNSYFAFFYHNTKTGAVEEIFPQELNSETVLSVYRSLDGMYIEAHAVENVIYGTVKGFNNEEKKVMLGDVWYELAETLTSSEFEISTDVEVFLDAYGRLAYIDSVGGKYDFKYAYLFDIRDDIEAEAVVVKLVTTGGEIKLQLADNVIIDGIKTPSNQILMNHNIYDGANKKCIRQVIRYKINKDGDIKIIDTSAEVTGGLANDQLKLSMPKQEVKYQPGGGLINGSYVVTKKTFTLVVPGVPVEKEDIDLYATTFNFIDDETHQVSMECYDVDDDSMTMGVCVYYPSEPLSAAVASSSNMSIAVFKKKQCGIWIDGEDQNTVTLFDSNGETTYLVANTITDETLKSLSFGDVVRYATNTKGQLSAIYTECDVTNETTALSHPAYNTKLLNYEEGYFNFTFGRVLRKENSYLVVLSNQNNQYFTNNQLANKKVVITSEMNSSGCWLVDMSEGKISKADISNLSEYLGNGVETPSYVYSRVRKGYAMSNLIIYKY